MNSFRCDGIIVNNGKSSVCNTLLFKASGAGVVEVVCRKCKKVHSFNISQPPLVYDGNLERHKRL